MAIFKKLIREIVNSLAYKTDHFADMNIIDGEFGDIYAKCVKYTVTSKISLYSLYKAVEYIVKKKVPGDFVECGVWKGGSAMVIIYTLLKMNETYRKIYLYDTYTGMTEPTVEDFAIPSKKPAVQKWNKNKFCDWSFATLKEVKENLKFTAYPQENLLFIKGRVEDTIPQTISSKIALLRLDTDWYRSTKHELIHLYPRLSTNGVLIVDDYGYWAGAKKAVDEYFKDGPILLNRIDQTGRIGVKAD